MKDDERRERQDRKATKKGGVLGEFTTALNYSGRALGCLALPLAVDFLLALIAGESAFLRSVGDMYPTAFALVFYGVGLGAGLLLVRRSFRQYTFWIALVYLPVAFLLMLYVGLGLGGGI